MSPDAMYLAALLGLVENIHCGVTDVVDHHKVTKTTAHTDAVLKAALESGMRFKLARMWVDRGTNAETQSAIMAEMARLFGEWHGRDVLVEVANGPSVPWRCSAETMVMTHELALQNNSFTHIHVSETEEEVKMCLDETSMRPISWMDAIGVLDDRTQIVHAVWADESEIGLMAQQGALVVHCPISNAVMASGIMPLAEMKKGGVRLRLATDGPASGDNQDIWEAVKLALSLSRISTLGAMAVAPADVLGMALSTDGLLPGMPADLVIVELDHARAVPVHDVTSALVLCCNGSDVDTVMVGGKILMRQKIIQFLDEEALFTECRQVVQGLRKQAGLDE